MVHFCETVIKTVLEYACPARHSSLTVEQCFRIESIQRRSFKLIYGPTSHYENICHDYPHMSLSDRRECLCKRFFIPLRTVKAAWTIYYPSQETQRQYKDYVIRFT